MEGGPRHPRRKKIRFFLNRKTKPAGMANADRHNHEMKP